MKKKLRNFAIVLAVAAAVSFVGSTQASAVDADVARAAAVVQPSAETVGPKEIKDHTIGGGELIDNGVGWNKLGAQIRIDIANSDVRKPGVVKEPALDAALQAKVNGPDLTGAYYAVGYYDVGDTNAGAIATVACKVATDTAISGGTQVTGLDAGANSRNTPVSSSFPGRMNWTTNAPIADRLDGWIVQFGGNAGTVSDKAPEKVKIWALCVPGVTLPVVETFVQSD